MDELTIKPIAYVRGEFSTKFGIPRQSGLVPELLSTVVFEPEYRDENALRHLNGYSHIWLIWGFSATPRGEFKPMVKPPRLGGNRRVGVFASRSPFRPNPLGLSLVELVQIKKQPGLGCVLVVAGADIMDGTPVYDIKPYLPFADSRPGATAGYAGEQLGHALEVEFPPELLQRVPEKHRAALLGVLRQDPRPAYQDGPATPYGFEFCGLDVRFRVESGTLVVFDVAEGAQPPDGRVK